MSNGIINCTHIVISLSNRLDALGFCIENLSTCHSFYVSSLTYRSRIKNNQPIKVFSVFPMCMSQCYHIKSEVLHFGE